MTTTVTTTTSTETANAMEEVTRAATGYQRTTQREKLDELKATFEEKVSALGIAAINLDSERDLEKIPELVAAKNAAQQAADEACVAYNNYKMYFEWENFFEAENPAEAALTAGYIEYAAQPRVQSRGGVAIATPKYIERQIDFQAFDRACRFRIFGAKLVQNANQLSYITALRENAKIGKSVAETNKLFDEDEKRVIIHRFDEVPTKAEHKRVLQDVLDDLLFVDNGEGKNRYMVTNHQLRWYTNAITNATYGNGHLDQTTGYAYQAIQTAAALFQSLIKEYGITIK